MSLEITVYAKELNDALIPLIQKRLNDFEMSCEIHPGFSFADQTGFLPFKFKLTNPPFDILKTKELISGFELYIEDFDFETEKANVQHKPTLVERWLKVKQEDVPLVNETIDNRLKNCKKTATFIWHVADSFEVRFATLTSAILTELTNGVCTYTAENIWYENEGFVETTWQEVKDYENTLKERTLKFHEFEKW